MDAISFVIICGGALGWALGTAAYVFSESKTGRRIAAWNRRDKERYARIFGEEPKM